MSKLSSFEEFLVVALLKQKYEESSDENFSYRKDLKEIIKKLEGR